MKKTTQRAKQIIYDLPLSTYEKEHLAKLSLIRKQDILVQPIKLGKVNIGSKTKQK